MNQQYVSRVASFASGREITFNHWAPTIGPNRKRNIIDGIILVCKAKVTPSTADLLLENLPRLFKNVRVADIEGDRVNCSGEGFRIWSKSNLGGRRFHEHTADIDSGSAATFTFWMYVPFRKPWIYGEEDFSIPADVFDQLVITCPADADFSIGTSTVAIDASTQYYAIALCREEGGPVTYYSRDVLRELTMQTKTEGAISLNGSYLAEALAYSPGDQAGTDAMSGWTAHRITPFQPALLSDDDWQAQYELYREAAGNSADPVLTGNAKVIWLPGPDTKLEDQPFVGGDALVHATSTETSVVFVYRTVVPKSKRVAATVARAYGVDLNTVKLATKTGKRENPAMWGQARRFLPAKGHKAG